MNLEERVLMAKTDHSIADELIKEYQKFILSCAHKSAGRFITKQDDEMSIALMAFHEAIQKYDTSRGSFLHFSGLIIKNRLIDQSRKDTKNANSVSFSDLSQTDDEGNVIDFDIEDTKAGITDTRLELEAFSTELNEFGISYFDLAKVTPKSEKTKDACFTVIRWILKNAILVNEIKSKKVLPMNVLLENVKINRKVIERHRKYIIAVVLIFAGDYEIIADYIPAMKEVYADERHHS